MIRLFFRKMGFIRKDSRPGSSLRRALEVYDSTPFSDLKAQKKTIANSILAYKSLWEQKLSSEIQKSIALKLILEQQRYR